MAIILVRRLAELTWFILLFCASAWCIDPKIFISLHATQRFAVWVYGYSSQENFDDLWVLAWIVCSLAFAIFGCFITRRIMQIVRR